MKLGDLRKLIREEVEGALDEVDKAKKGPPDSFGAFRKQLGAALKKAKAPPGLVSEVEDVDNEGGGVAAACWSAWYNMKDELKDARADKAEAWKTSVEYYVHDLVIDMVDEFSNPMNYEPGAKRGQKPVDGPTLAQAVVKAMLSGSPKPSAESLQNKKVRDLCGVVFDILNETQGATDDVEWDGKSNSMTFKINRSDYLEAIAAKAMQDAGLEPGGDDTEFLDPHTGLTVHFGDGVATVS